MTISRDPQEAEYLVALVAGQIAAATMASGSAPDLRVSVGTAERIIEEIISRRDNGEPGPELDPGAIWIDEFSSQRNDGSDKRMGINIEWKRGPEIGPEGNTLEPLQVTSLMGAIIRTVEEWVESEDGAPGLQVLFDAD
jgi:hypothetical protein